MTSYSRCKGAWSAVHSTARTGIHVSLAHRHITSLAPRNPHPVLRTCILRHPVGLSMSVPRQEGSMCSRERTQIWRFTPRPGEILVVGRRRRFSVSHHRPRQTLASLKFVILFTRVAQLPIAFRTPPHAILEESMKRAQAGFAMYDPWLRPASSRVHRQLP